MFYTITCVNNTAQNAADFTLDISKVHLIDQFNRKWPPITAQIPSISDTGQFGWFNTFLSASTTSVAAHQFAVPPQPYSFVIAAVLSLQEQGKFHRLVYDASPGQPVLMMQDGTAGVPVPAFHDIVRTSDFKAGQSTSDPQLPPPRCPTPYDGRRKS